MPAKRGGGLRKGIAGKKLQIEKMVETAKKTQPQGKQASNTLKKGHDNANGASAPTHIVALKKTQEAADHEANSTVRISKKTAIVRLPGQGSVSVSKKMRVVYNQPPFVLPSLPKASKNPNHVVVRLPPQQPPKEPTNFLSLPNEIRNTIYDLAMPHKKYGIRFIRDKARPSTELTYHLPLSVTVSGPQLSVEAGKRRRLFDLPKRLYIDAAIPPYRLSPGPAALLLVSKKVNEDTAPILYGRNVFSFYAMQPLRKFLDRLRPQTRPMVRSLEIAHYTAGDPKETKDQVWKDIYDHSWNNLCFQIRDQCTGLASLALRLTINDIPFDMGPLANWMSPLYAFMNLDHLKKLDLRLHQVHTDDAILKVEAYEIRKELMGPNFYESLTPMKDAFVEKPKAKARPGVNALRIVGNMHTQHPTRRAAHDLSHLPPSQGGPTVFVQLLSPTDDHPLYHKKGSSGEKAAIVKMQLQHKKERLEKKEMAQAKKMNKSKAKA
ncbi:MAG: hypothetical protein L6R39_003887 [Caloplaca ligustica]|nr:MAG: hypothetical protein L6R39_003887 [Caloplaca ligustica]